MKELKSIFPRALTFTLSLVIVLAAAQAQAIITTYINRDAFDAAVPTVFWKTGTHLSKAASSTAATSASATATSPIITCRMVSIRN